MTSEWMKVMLEEIARKQAEADAARIEEERRAQHQADTCAASAPTRAPR